MFEHLPVGYRLSNGLPCLDFLDGTRLLAPGVIDEEFGVYSEFAIEHIFWQLRYVIKRARSVLGEPRRNAGADVPNIGDGLVVPHGFAK